MIQQQDNGRDASGRFTKGNPGGPGNPHAKRGAVALGGAGGAWGHPRARRPGSTQGCSGGLYGLVGWGRVR